MFSRYSCVRHRFYRYLSLQRKLHPDLFQTKPRELQDIAQEQSTIVNDSYRTLSSPYERSKLILSIDGYDVGEEGTTLSDPELLMEIMDVRERIELAATEEELEDIGKKNAENIEKALKSLEASHKCGDLGAACRWTIRLRYLNTIRNEVYDLVD